MQPIISLYSGLRTELHGFKLLRESVKLGIRALLYRRQTARWLDLLNSNPLFGHMLPACPRLVNKIYRNYLSVRFSCTDRLDTLKTHYDTVIDKGLAPLVARAAAGSVILCQLQSKHGYYTIELRAGGMLCREGELIFNLLHNGSLVYSLACVFVREGTQLLLGIGCLQGAANGQDSVREATRALHGIRPKNLLVRLARQFGYDHGCAAMLLVGNANRVVTRSLRKGKVHSDYNGLWIELGATQRADGDFELACEHLPKLDILKISSNKRSEARKRHDMLSAAISAIKVQFACSKSYGGSLMG